MKTRLKIKTKLAALALACSVIAPSLHAQLPIPFADGSDGALNITTGTTNFINLADASAGSSLTWTNSSPILGRGIYDPAQWAVVFKYSSVNIASNTTLSFSNNLAHAPVVWLVNGNVTINGSLNLDGRGSNNDPNNLVEPGPGGFRGGGGSVGLSGVGSGPGFGPGGGDPVGGNSGGRYAGSYGNPQIIPLIGGSGGGGNSSGAGNNGASGGGAILIAATGNITINGYCHANGGDSIGTGAASGGPSV